MVDPLQRAPANAAGTIIGGALDLPDNRLSALWRHDGAVAALSREYRARLLCEASSRVVSEGAR
jgi:hypothetical protein